MRALIVMLVVASLVYTGLAVAAPSEQSGVAISARDLILLLFSSVTALIAMHARSMSAAIRECKLANTEQALQLQNLRERMLTDYQRRVETLEHFEKIEKMIERFNENINIRLDKLFTRGNE